MRKKISIHSPHAGRDAEAGKEMIMPRISIHSPHAGRDPNPLILTHQWAISIHSPHAGRDFREVVLWRMKVWNFNPLSPCGERQYVCRSSRQVRLFQSTLPMRGETGTHQRLCQCDSDFNPLSPCGERLSYFGVNEKILQFQSTLPMRGETDDCHDTSRSRSISIHSPHAGRDAYRQSP